LSQQKESCAHTAAAQLEHDVVNAAPVAHSLCAQPPPPLPLHAVEPQNWLTLFTQIESHWLLQQYGSAWQTDAAHVEHDVVNAAPVVHSLCAQPLPLPVHTPVPQYCATSLTHV